MEDQANTDDDLLGQSIGNYQVKKKLGEGGMGAVYLAEHPLIGKKVALKVLHPELSSNKIVVERFFHEAKAVNDIQHPNIVDIIDYGVIEGEGRGSSLVYFFMEFLPGLSLTEVVQEHAPLPPERALMIAAQIGDALAASHKSGIVHRDLKPDNIILLERRHQSDFVKVLDFGIAKLTGEGKQSRRTRTGIVMGTPAYMSPEQCEGKGQIDHRTDVYALGVVLYELLTGRVPFMGEGYGEVLVQHLTQPVPPPTTFEPTIPPHVEQLVLKALMKPREARYPSMEEFLRALIDPVGYVDSHGGLGGFLNTPLAETAGPPPRLHSRPGSVATPAPLYVTPSPSTGMRTPYPGQPTPYPAQASTPGYAPGVATPTPGTVPTPHPGSVPGQAPSGVYTPHPSQVYEPTSRRSKAGLVIALVAVLGVGGGIAALVLGGGTDEPAAATVADAGTADVDQTAAAAQTLDAAAVSTDAAPPRQLAVEPRREISVKTSPEGAELYIGGELVGKTPDVIEIADSDEEVTLRIVLDGYQKVEKMFQPNKNIAFDLDLKKDVRARADQGPARERRAGRRSGRRRAGKPSKTRPKSSPKSRPTKTRTGDTDVLRPSL